MPKAKDILDEIYHAENCYLINNDIGLTQKIRKEIECTDWESLKRNNDEMLSKERAVSNIKMKDALMDNCFSNLNQLKMISRQIPQNTRFSFIKKLIIKLMMVCVRYQEEFNNNLVNLLSFFKDVNATLINRVNENGKQLVKMDQGIMSLEKKIEEIKEENLSQKQQIQDLVERHVQINYEKDDKTKNLVELLEKIQEHSENHESWLEALTKENKKNEDWLSIISERVNNNELWIDEVQKNAQSIDTKMLQIRSELFSEINLQKNCMNEREKIIVKFMDSYQTYLQQYPNIKKVNLGCGLVTYPEYINIDIRQLEGVDIVADILALPFDEQELDEIFAAHLLEHFELKRIELEILPYWKSLLKSGGVLRLIVPDIDYMIKQYVNNEITFDNLREIIFGGQEYQGNYHYTMFSSVSLIELLRNIGFREVKIIAIGRKNGECYEMEIEATT